MFHSKTLTILPSHIFMLATIIFNLVHMVSLFEFSLLNIVSINLLLINLKYTNLCSNLNSNIFSIENFKIPNRTHYSTAVNLIYS